jgi:hypothetical protein
MGQGSTGQDWKMDMVGRDKMDRTGLNVDRLNGTGLDDWMRQDSIKQGCMGQYWMGQNWKDMIRWNRIGERGLDGTGWDEIELCENVRDRI